MNLPAAIEHLRAMHDYSKQSEGVEDHEEATNAQALAVAIEALGAFEVLLREGKPPIDTTKSAPPLTASEQVAGIWGKGKGLFDGPRDENGIPEP